MTSETLNAIDKDLRDNDAWTKLNMALGMALYNLEHLPHSTNPINEMTTFLSIFAKPGMLDEKNVRKMWGKLNEVETQLYGKVVY